ncbi:MAG: peptidyl-alpha-hydroxyglycine alpha-amidating lyase family protein [Vicinamibacterales bacterium]|nr:peptidyl-alpha-hydroxyglycine alpha-amidating lyase family protein [Vicinamibacterales bacterium]
MTSRTPIVATVGMTVGLTMALMVSLSHGAEPSRYHRVENWSPVPVPGGPEWEMSGAAVSADGRRLFMSHRSDPPILSINPASARILRSWGDGLLVWPHSLYLDRDDNLWVADAAVGSGAGAGLNPPMSQALAAGHGHQVLKFSRDGRLLRTLGTAGQPGTDATHFNAPTGVAVARNGDIFISDGHGGTTNARVVVFDRRGQFLRTWGTRGTGPGEFGEPHAIALDARERVIVADRTNGRLQVFDTSGRFLAQWTGFGRRPCGIAIGTDDTIYVSSHDARAHENIITVARASDGQVIEVITDALDGIEGIAVDGKGTIYATSATGHAVAKYVRR